MLIFLCAFHLHIIPITWEPGNRLGVRTHIFLWFDYCYIHAHPILWLPGTFHVSLPVSKFSTPGLNTHGKWSHCGNTQFDKCPGKWALLLLLKGKCYIYPTDNAAGFPTGVPSSRYECVMQINFLTRESVSHYKQPLRNKILRSANTKYYYSHLFFYKINKEDLQLMYSCDFWCEFIDLVGFFGCYGLT